jgi:hypothetical protein
MDLDTRIAELDPARRHSPGHPDPRLYQQIIRRPARRPARVLIPAVALVTAAVAGLALASRPAPAPVVRLTAQQVLDRAATAALARPAVVPGPRQFVYLKTVTSGSGPSDGVAQYWLSVTGTRNGLTEQAGHRAQVILGCAHGRQTVHLLRYKGPHYHGPAVVRVPCTPVPAYLPTLPSRPGPLLVYLGQHQAVRPGNLNDLFKAVDGLLGTDYLRPGQRAALYRLLARSPGLTVVPHATDIAGRTGLGVRWTYRGSTATMVFARGSFAYLGLTIRGQGGSALLRMALVNRAGERP